MKRDKYIFIVILFIVIIFDIMFITSKKEKYSDIENRYLSEFKIDNITEYLGDHFPYRVDFIKIKNRFSYLVGKRYINGIYIGKENYLVPEVEKIDDDKKNLMIKRVNEFSSNHAVDVMIVPDSILINKDKLSLTIGNNEEDEINDLYKSFKNSNNINVINSLKDSNLKDDNMYYHTDHHWTSYGAYVGYKEYMKSKGYEYQDLDYFKLEELSNNFKGTSLNKVIGLGLEDRIYAPSIYNNLSVYYVLEDKITNSLYNLDYLKERNQYALFLDNNHALIEITNNDSSSDKEILILKNSYANSFIPFIVNEYKKTYVIDLRYYNKKVSDYLVDKNVNDILVLYNLNNLYSDTSLIKLK